MTDKTNKTALITGASYGIGFEFAKQLAQQNYNLVIVSRSKDRLNEIKKTFEKEYSIKVTVMAEDLSKLKSADNLFQNCQKNNIIVDLLINNAGVGIMGESIDQDTRSVENMLNLNITTLTKLCNFFGKTMAERKNGNILNISSLVGTFPIPYFSMYAATKSYVLNYSLGLRNELKSKGVNVSCLLPGYVKTSFDDNAQITSENYKKLSKAMGITPDKVAKIGLKAVKRKKALTIAGLSNKMMPLVTSIIPDKHISAFMGIVLRRILKDQ